MYRTFLSRIFTNHEFCHLNIFVCIVNARWFVLIQGSFYFLDVGDDDVLFKIAEAVAVDVRHTL